MLGLMHGIAFSASYQMVARFGDKNTSSLGLGWVSSGLLALGLEVASSFSLRLLLVRIHRAPKS